MNLLAGTLPGSRSVAVGSTATGFTTEINNSKGAAFGCRIEASGGLPVTFLYQTTNASNQLTGTPNTPATIPPGGAQNFLFAVTPSSPFPPGDVGLQYLCDNGEPAPSVITQIDANATPTFAVFVSASATVPFDPENNRAIVRFKDSSDIDRGSASVAIRTE